MEVISLPRGRGKSFILVSESAKTNTPIITATKNSAESLKFTAKQMGVEIPTPLVASTLKYNSLIDKDYYIDDIDVVWSIIFGGCPVIGTLTPTNEIEY